MSDAETVLLRNISREPREVAVLGHVLVEPDCVVEVPARLVNHQAACADESCSGCLVWPEETWQVEQPTRRRTKKSDEGE